MTNKNGEILGLYYPFIHFRDEDWLIRSTLYWDRMARIVPEQTVQDSLVVRTLINELGYVEDRQTYSPELEVKFRQLGQEFTNFINNYSGPLRNRYGLQRFIKRNRKTGKVVADIVGMDKCPDIEKVYHQKVTMDLCAALCATDLAFANEWDDNLRMHRKLADVYMTCLAKMMAGEEYRPVADNALCHYARLTGHIESMAHVLLPKQNILPETNKALDAHETLIETNVAMVGLRLVVPVLSANLSPSDKEKAQMELITKIKQLRAKNHDELHLYRKCISEFVTDNEFLFGIASDPAQVEAALQDKFEKQVQKQMQGVNRLLKEKLGETAVSFIFMSPWALISKGMPEIRHPLEPISLAVAALTGSAWLILTKQRRDVRKALGPSVYLLHVEEHLNDADCKKRWKQGMRSFFCGV